MFTFSSNFDDEFMLQLSFSFPGALIHADLLNRWDNPCRDLVFHAGSARLCSPILPHSLHCRPRRVECLLSR